MTGKDVGSIDNLIFSIAIDSSCDLQTFFQSFGRMRSIRECTTFNIYLKDFDPTKKPTNLAELLKYLGDNSLREKTNFMDELYSIHKRLKKKGNEIINPGLTKV